MVERMNEERWASVPGWEGCYEVSDRGSVRRVGVDTLGRLKTRTLSPDHSKGGYARVHLKHGERQERLFVHRLVLEVFVGEKPEGMVPDHIDRNPSNNAVKNLRWVTPSENQLNRDTGRFRRGEATPWAKLTSVQVEEARRCAANGVSIRSLSRLCCVAEETMRDAVSGVTWRAPGSVEGTQ
ncbi:hypothetical protein CEE55_02350 [Stenotrophomonas pavanii]|uniref:HNH nuclease domain-containing protein n=2 Tax=Lysobacteraceae TaxID=32033 RepID=A0A2D0ANZ6_9GAMM|nr:hypothetical protein CEE55_02350 [Stenotrophomonas pavanii]DAH87206.1 MAG TPA: homing endonuclease [Caudoviricetes sp.]